MLVKTFDAALFAGTLVEKLACRLPTITAATATTTMAKTAAIAMSATCQNPGNHRLIINVKTLRRLLMPFYSLSVLNCERCVFKYYCINKYKMYSI